MILMSSYYILKVERSSLFLAAFDKTSIPYIYIATAVLTYVATRIFGDMTSRGASRANLLLLPKVFWTLCMLVFWFSIQILFEENGTPYRICVGAFILWINVFIVAETTSYWILAGDIFGMRDGRRYYSWVGMGGIIGAGVGSWCAGWFSSAFGEAPLMLVAAGLFCMLIPVTRFIMNVSREEEAYWYQPPARRSTRGRGAGAAAGGLGAVLGNPYLAAIFLVTVMSTVTSTLVDYHFHVQSQEHYREVVLMRGGELKDLLAGHFSRVFTMMNVFSLCMQIFLVPMMLRMSIGAPLGLLPALVLGAGLNMTMGGGLTSTSILYALIFATMYSIHQTTKEFLFIPCEGEIKYAGRAFIDVFGYRLGPAICGTAMLLVQSGSLLTPSFIGTMLLVFTFLWGAAVVRIDRDFSTLSAEAEETF